MNANANTPLVLRAASDGEGRPLPLGLSGFPTEADGVPISYRKVKLARVGNWTHRGTGEPVTITPDRVDEWVKNTKALSAAGVKPFLPGQHRSEFNAADNHGYLIDLAREGDDLFGVFALYGDDALKRAAVNGRSIYVVADARDAKGNVYKGESIAHVALVPNPALPDLGGTVKIAASANAPAVDVPVLELNCGTGAGGFQSGNTCAGGGGGNVDADRQQKREEIAQKTGYEVLSPGSVASQISKAGVPIYVNTKREKRSGYSLQAVPGKKTWLMAEWHNIPGENHDYAAKSAELETKLTAAGFEVSRPFPDKTLLAIRKPAKPTSLSLSGAPMTEQQLDSIRELIGADDVTDETAIPLLIEWGNKSKATADKATTLSADKTRLEGELAAEKSKVLSLSATAPKQPDPEILRDRADIYASRIDLMLERGDMPKFVADKLKAKVAPTAVLMLSASADFDNKRPIDFVLSLFDGAKLGIQAGNPVNRGTVAQPLALSGDNGNADEKKIVDEAGKSAEAWRDEQLKMRGLQPAGK